MIDYGGDKETEEHYLRQRAILHTQGIVNLRKRANDEVNKARDADLSPKTNDLLVKSHKNNSKKQNLASTGY